MENIIGSIATDSSVDYQAQINYYRRIAKQECHPVVIKYADAFFDRCIKLDDRGEIIWDQVAETWTPMRLIETSKMFANFCRGSRIRFRGCPKTRVDKISCIFSGLAYDLV